MFLAPVPPPPPVTPTLTVHTFSIERLVQRQAAIFADSIAQTVRRALWGMSPADRLVYLEAIHGLTNEWVGDEIHAREELGMVPDQRA